MGAESHRRDQCPIIKYNYTTFSPFVNMRKCVHTKRVDAQTSSGPMEEMPRLPQPVILV